MALKKAQNTTLTGIIIPVDWSDDQEVISAALATSDEKVYQIGGNRKGKELLAFLQHQLEVTGTLSKDDKGKPVITVRRYIVK